MLAAVAVAFSSLAFEAARRASMHEKQAVAVSPCRLTNFGPDVERRRILLVRRLVGP